MTVSAIAGTLRNGLGQLVQCWDTPKRFGTVGAMLGHSETDININENGYV